MFIVFQTLTRVSILRTEKLAENPRAPAGTRSEEERFDEESERATVDEDLGEEARLPDAPLGSAVHLSRKDKKDSSY